MSFKIGDKAVIINPWSGFNFGDGTVVVIPDYCPNDAIQYLVTDEKCKDHMGRVAESELREYTKGDHIRSLNNKELADLALETIMKLVKETTGATYFEDDEVEESRNMILNNLNTPWRKEDEDGLRKDKTTKASRIM